MIFTETFTCTRDDLTIHGTMFTNVKASEMTKPLPIAVVSHGFIVNRKAVRHYAKHLAELGWAAFTFDFCGGCVKGRSEGKTTDMTVLTEKEDVKAVVRYARSLLFTDNEKLLLMGCSQGGFVSALAAKEVNAQKIVLFYPALCIPDDARRGQMMYAKFDPSDMPEVIRCGPIRLGRCFPSAVMDMDPYKEISDYTGDVLIIHGSDDSIVDVSYAENAYEAYRKNGSRRIVSLHILQNADHGFKKDEDRNALYALDRFLENKQEILSIDTETIDKILEKKTGRSFTLTLPFKGTAESEWFSGVIAPGASELQQWDKGKAVSCRMECILHGRDYTGSDCQIRLISTAEKDGIRRTVLETDSEALSFLNCASFDTNPEYRRKGPLVRVFSKIPAEAEKSA